MFSAVVVVKINYTTFSCFFSHLLFRDLGGQACRLENILASLFADKERKSACENAPAPALRLSLGVVAPLG